MSLSISSDQGLSTCPVNDTTTPTYPVVGLNDSMVIAVSPETVQVVPQTNIYPTHWTNMSTSFALENVEVGSPEYIQVFGRFIRSCPSNLFYGAFKGVTLQRIQNKPLYSMYHAFKQAHEIEVTHDWLMHGCSAENATKIAKEGFNRCFAGKHGNLYGWGCYFTTNAKLAMTSTYSPCNEKLVKTVIIAEVATGKSVLGCSSLQEAPVGYNSTTNNQKDIFVTFKDYQSYPKYILSMDVTPLVNVMVRCFSVNRKSLWEMLRIVFSKNFAVSVGTLRSPTLDFYIGEDCPFLQDSKDDREKYINRVNELFGDKKTSLAKEEVEKDTQCMQFLKNITEKFSKTGFLNKNMQPNMPKIMSTVTQCTEIVQPCVVLHKIPMNMYSIIQKMAGVQMHQAIRSIVMLRTFSDIIQEIGISEIKFHVVKYNIWVSTVDCEVWFNVFAHAQHSDQEIKDQISRLWKTKSPQPLIRMTELLPRPTITPPAAKRARK